MYKILIVLLIALVPTLGNSYDLKKLKYSKDPRIKSSPLAEFNSSFRSCKDDSVTILNNGGGLLNLADFLKNDSCKFIGVLPETSKIDKGYCDNVDICSSFQDDKSEGLSQEDRDFIYSEWVGYYLRENTNAEVDKLTNAKSDNFKDLLKGINQLPDDIKSKVSFCEEIKNTNGKCIDDDNWDKVVQQNVIERILKTSKDATVTGTRKSEMLMQLEAGTVALNPNLTFGVGEICIFQTGCQKEPPMTKIPLRVDELKGKDLLVEEISNTIKLASKKNGKLGKVAIKNIIKKSIHNYASTGEDKIFGYNPLSLDSNIDVLLRNMDFSFSDFNGASGTVELKKKLNKIRGGLASIYVEQDCGENNLSLTQACNNLQKSLTMDKVMALFKKKSKSLNRKGANASIFVEMAKYYENQPENIDKRQKLLKMGENPQHLYEKYLSFLMEKRTCDEKFEKKSMLSLAPPPTKEEVASREKKLRDTQVEVAKEVEKSIEKNPELKKVYESYGAKWSNEKTKDIVASNSNKDTNNLNAKNIEPETVAKTAEVAPVKQNPSSTNVASAKTETKGMVNSFNKAFSSNSNDAISNTKNVASDKFEQDKILKETLADLESKEKKLAKKMAAVKKSSDDLSDDIGTGKDKAKTNTKTKETNLENEELQKLKKQIDDLKKSQTQNNSPKTFANANNPAASSEDLNQNKGTERGHSALSIKANPEVGIDRTAENSYKAPQNAASINTETSQVTSSTASLAKASASANASSAVTKGSSDKNNFGILLSKTGEALIDPSSIVDNPQEADILNLLERSHGQPFLIKENGTLVKVAPLFDDSGKPQISKDGKPLFKKVRLSKDQQATIAKETDIIKSSKEIGPSPVRLFNLKSLIDVSVQRN